MKIRIDTCDIKNALKILSKINSSDILMEAENQNLILRKQSLNTLIRINVYGKCIENGKSVLPECIIPLLEILKTNEITISNDEVEAVNKTIEYKEVHDFPFEPYIEPAKRIFTVAESELHRLLEVKYAIADDKTRPALTGVYFGKNETAACDGYRLAIRKGTYESSENFIVNRESIKIIDSIIDKNSEEMVTVYIDKGYVRFQIKNISITCETIEAEFFNYRSVIPYEFEYKAEVNVDNLKEELDFAKNSGILKLNFNKDKLILIRERYKEVYDSEASDEATQNLRSEAHLEYTEKYEKWLAKKSKAKKNNKAFNQKCPIEKTVKPQKRYKNVFVAAIKSQIDCKLNSNDEFHIGINAMYLREAIEHYSGYIALQMGTPVSPILIKNDMGTELILPIRLAD